jgi:hypothetical protein
MKSTEPKSSFKTIMKPKKRFTKQNQLKKESKEMNSKVKVPRLQETKEFVTQKSKSNQDGTKDNMESFKRDERRNMEEKSENKKFKTGRQISLTSTTH